MGAPPNDHRSDQNQSLEVKRLKVRPRSGPSAEKVSKKIEKIEKSRALGLQKTPRRSQTSATGVQPDRRATIRGGVTPPSKYLSKLRYKQQLLQTTKNLRSKI